MAKRATAYPIYRSSISHSGRGRITRVSHTTHLISCTVLILCIFTALYGAQYLELLIGKKLMELSPSTTLDELYAAGLVHSTRAKAQEATVPSQQEAESVAIIMKEQTRDDNAEDVMLLKRWNGKLLAESFKLPEMEVEIERAVEQVEKAIQSEAEQREKKRMDELIMAKQAEQKKP